MKRTATILCLTLGLLALLDFGVGQVLGWAERSGRLGSLVQYFEYGRSVPGKLARWQDRPGTPGNLMDVAWRPEMIARSAVEFEAEAPTTQPVIRGYGMSFVNNILQSAATQDPGLILDLHSGPAAPPNFTYALFEEDRDNRRAGDVAVLGILSSSVPAMGALSNSTWMFEQPAPFTYPVYYLEENGLRRVEPLVSSQDSFHALRLDPATRAAWQDQLKSEDHFHALATFGVPSLDASPFVRLARRSLATSHVQSTQQDILRSGAYPYGEVLRRMVVTFAQTARSDRQRPVIFLIQTRDATDADLLEILKPVLEAQDIPYLATVEHFDPRDPSGFLGDGHYKPQIDQRFARAFVDLITP
ncbi:MAG: hypothetical protein AAF231_03345 [Pseudomonadota bacterium]